MYSNQHKWTQLTFMFMDCAVSVLAFLIAGIWRFAGIMRFIDSISFKEILLVVVLSSFGSFVISGLYRDIFRRGFLHEFNRVLTYSFVLILLVTLYSFATKNTMALSRLTLLYFFFINNVLIYSVHIIIKLVYRGYVKGSAAWKLLIIADMDNVAVTCQNIHNGKLADRVIGIYILDHQEVDSELLHGIPIINPPTDIVDFIVQNPVDEVLLSIMEPRYVSDDIQTLRNKIVESGAVFSLKVWSIQKDEPYVLRLVEFGNDYILSYANRKYNFSLVQLKRLMDIVGGLVGSLLTVILCVFLFPAILIESPGPVFFRQKRVGRNGRIITILKFRSMYKDAEERKASLMKNNKMKGLLFKIDNDPRITRVGKFIRKTSLDEFPQFFNVLKGDMSLVGTRPPTLDEYRHYSPAQKKRLCFRPGLTGVWQTNGRSNITDFDDVLQMDLQYIRDWSIYLDIKLILKTIVVIILRKGAK